MDKNEYIIKHKEMFKVLLCQYETIKEPFEISQKDPIFQLLSKFSEIKFILNQDIKKLNLNLMKIFYFNKKKINEILYEAQKIINIDNIIDNKLSDYFYLTLLIEDNIDIVNYEYSLDFINIIFNQLKQDNNNNYKKIILSKIIIELINNYKGTDNYNKALHYGKLNEIENSDYIKKSKESIKELGLNIDENIDKIYSDIIIKLIKENKIDDYENTYKIINELDLENINITKTMFEELSKTLNTNEKYIKKYIIKEIKDLDNHNIINFYYILFKYILKNPIYIYNIPLLLEQRKNIIKFIKTNKNYENDNKQKFKYILNFITNRQYDILYKEIEDKNSNLTSSKISTNNNSNNNNFVKTSEISTDSEDYYEIMKFKYKIGTKNNNYKKFIREISNGDIIFGDSENELYSYRIDINKKQEKEEKICFELNNYKKEYHVHTGRNNKKEKNKPQIVTKKVINNIIEINGTNEIQIFECCKDAVILYSLSIENQITASNIMRINISCTGCFEINKDKEYIIFGDKGIFHFYDLPSDSNQINIEDAIKDKRPFKGGIKISDNYLALTSNSMLPNGEDILAFYDIKNKKIIETKNKVEFSFNIGVDGLNLMEIGKDKKEILLCACKKYKLSQKNGILIINPEIKEKEEIKFNFYDTEEFEVNCFCPINIKEKNSYFTSNYFLVGGYDNEKNIGIIKLYKITSNDKFNTNFNLTLLQDIIIEKTKKFKGFNGTVRNMIQLKNRNLLLVNCWDGNIYFFSKPNISFYLKEEKEE